MKLLRSVFVAWVGWSPSSWRSVKPPSPQIPLREEEFVAMEGSVAELRTRPPLVFAGECDRLRGRIAEAAVGKGFLLTAGNCAEALGDGGDVNRIRDDYRLLLQLALILTYETGLPVIKMGRVAGQYAKPRSNPMEERGGTVLPVYRGDIYNSLEFDAANRSFDPKRMLSVYDRSVQTANIVRAFASGGFADIHRLHAWNLEFVDRTRAGSSYRELSSRVDETLRFMRAIGADDGYRSRFTDAYFSHESLFLPYEEALCRTDSITGDYYACSGHFLWLGERTRDLKGPHVEFLRGISNPIGIKVSEKVDVDELVELVEKLNPLDIPGKITLITRMGAKKLKKKLPELITAMDEAFIHPPLWCCDPVHGNTITSPFGYKTRSVDAIMDEVRVFFDIHRDMGSHPGGLHLELTSDDVTECYGGDWESGKLVEFEDVSQRYKTKCDPRLNAEQALQIAFGVADYI